MSDIYNIDDGATPIKNIDKLIEDLYQRRYDDLFYSYPSESIIRIKHALKLQELVKERMEEEKPHENDRDYYDDPYQLLQSLIKESEK